MTTAMLQQPAHAPVTPLKSRMVRPARHPVRRWLIIGGVMLALAAAVVAFAVRRPRGTAAPAFRFETSAVSRGPIRAKVTATGTVNPIVSVSVGSQVSGTIQKLGADFNSVVEPGQMIAQIDPRTLKAAVGQAQANLLAARANIDKAKAQRADALRQSARLKTLATQKLVAQQEADTAQTNAEVAAAGVEAALAAEAQARAALDTTRLNLSFTTIVSPIHGTVITRNVDVGQTVAASFAAPVLFVIGEDLTKMEVDTNIAEADVGRLTSGLKATFTVDAYPAKVFTGIIREIRNSPQIIQNVVTYNAVVDVSNDSLELKPGMTANIEVVYADRDDALRVENAALRFRPPPEVLGQTAPAPQGRKLVWLLREGKPVPVVIKPGVSDGTTTEVLEGDVQAADRAITEAVSTKPSSLGRVL
jgi:HlyD family secretion protein